MANLLRTLLSYQTQDPELLSQLDFIKSRDVEDDKLHELIDTIGKLVLAPPSKEKELKTLKNRARFLEMEARGDNPLLSSLTERQRKALCNPNCPLNMIGTGEKYLAEGASGSVSSIDISGITYALKKGHRGKDILKDFLVGKELSHPHILKTLMYVEKETGSYLFLDFIPGKHYLDFSNEENLSKKIGHIASAILYLDSKSKVCFDLHLGNLMFTENKGVMIDLGDIVPHSNFFLNYSVNCLGEKMGLELNRITTPINAHLLSDLKAKCAKLQNCKSDDEARSELASLAKL